MIMNKKPKMSKEEDEIMAIIRVENLKKEFKRQIRKEGLWGSIQGLFNSEYEVKTAVNNITFQIERGEIVGYIGPNGAGKSTTIKMLVGILVPTSGHIEVNGLIPYKNRIENAKRMGVVFGQRTQLWWDIPVSESFNLMKHMYKISDKQYKENIELFFDILGIKEFFNIPTRQLSLGQRMRADICASLLHNPEILYLDEPTIGLDVVFKENMRQFIKEINKTRKTTIILTTHDVSDIEKLCSRVMVIDKGSIMYDGDLPKLKSIYGTGETLIAETDSEVQIADGFSDAGIINITCNLNKITVKYDKRYINSTQILSKLMGSYKIIDFLVKEIEIEEIIRRMYKDISEKDFSEVNKH